MTLVERRDFHPFERVILVTDKYESECLPRGSVGAVIDNYPCPQKFVEVSNTETSETIVLFMAVVSELEAAPK
jgi:hypothetical protein